MSALLVINEVAIEAPRGASIFERAESAGVRVPTSCLKQGKCRECMVEVLEGDDHLTPPTPEESHLGRPYRLSCRARFAGDVGRVRCHTMRRGRMHIEDRGATHLASAHPLDPAVTRDGHRVLLDGRAIAEVDGPLLGVAVDVGTTTIVARLHDLETGAALATQSFENPQRFGGSDVMSRIRFDTDHKGRLLQRTLLGYLGHAIEAFPCDPRNIYEMIVAANTTMRDLFFGLPVESIGQRPYKSLTEHELRAGKRATTSLSVPARRLRLPIHPDARVYGLPLIGGHVGADAAACLLAIDLARAERPVALMDIGTNTELVVGSRHRAFAASCPAGPAFEGGEIRCGMPALDGAIERVRIAEGGGLELGTIGAAPPSGICGSGLVDLLSELLRTGRMNALGRLDEGAERFVLDAARDVYLHENDISLLAQAKGANVTGLKIVLETAGLAAGDLDRFYLAGGFAAHLDPVAAQRIGLVPELPADRIVRLGNASVEGAAIALLSRARRQELEFLVRTIEHVELETNPGFFDHFVDACQYAPVGAAGGEAVA